MVPHIPILRFGEEYASLDTSPVPDHQTGEKLAIVSLANGGLIRRDLINNRDRRSELSVLSYRDIITICKNAADFFLESSLPINQRTQDASDYVDVLSQTTGLPYSLCYKNMEKIATVLRNMDQIIGGLTRGLDPSIFDVNSISQNEIALCYHKTCESLGIVLPNNSPAVNSLWLPAIAMKIPVVLKPGKNDPWTPWRIIQSLVRAGCPPASFAYYPTSHEGANAILELCDRSIVFGGQATVEQYAHDARISVHGPGHSKIVFGHDIIDNWRDYKDIVLESILANSGRSCINVSTIIVPKFRSEIAAFLAKEMTKVSVLDLSDPNAQIAAFPSPEVAEAIDATLESLLIQPGAIDVTTQLRSTPRLCKLDGSVFLNPTVVDCEDSGHMLAQKEYLFPYVAVVEVPQDKIAGYIGPTLSLTALTNDESFIRDLLDSNMIQRLNIGTIPTTQVDWSQPHEGNLFEFLYRRIAIQR